MADQSLTLKERKLPNPEKRMLLKPEIITNPIQPDPTQSNRVGSCRVVSGHIGSCLVVSGHVGWVVWNRVVAARVVSCRVVSCPGSSWLPMSLQFGSHWHPRATIWSLLITVWRPSRSILIAFAIILSSVFRFWGSLGSSQPVSRATLTEAP